MDGWPAMSAKNGSGEPHELVAEQSAHDRLGVEAGAKAVRVALNAASV